LRATVIQNGRHELWPPDEIYWVNDDDQVLGIGRTFTLSGANARNGEFAINVGVLADGPFSERIEYTIDIAER
jgi:archaeosine-15-forming tRNA-guanine transglycosylase